VTVFVSVLEAAAAAAHPFHTALVLTGTTMHKTVPFGGGHV
jgi:hypothetical protein